MCVQHSDLIIKLYSQLKPFQRTADIQIPYPFARGAIHYLCTWVCEAYEGRRKVKEIYHLSWTDRLQPLAIF